MVNRGVYKGADCFRQDEEDVGL